MHSKMLLALALAGATCHAGAALNLMGAEWATAACEQWNRTPNLLDGLSSDWIRNDGGKGFKVIHLYRTECGEPSQVELRIASKDGKAQCVYGGAVQNATMNTSVDYTMHAATPQWGEMGRGQYGPMRAMMFGALQFTGPKLEAMGVMGPFESFLLLVGKVPGETAACPGR
ncbi:SCP2 sterol-binding domain-containing protein [Ideonella sp. A 288]|uniref:SCP2 sterol-binding domain-containing protein n=1 Tax=Ideonella sp. A 288 TaxID=1962181 RepID=UPI000B4C1837|nr:SCP2 sterol-binding domain-containing protein [Ideonella sp. A 288]